MKKIIATILTLATILGILTFSVNAASYQTGSYTVTANSGLNVRSGAGTNYSVVGAATKGTTFTVSRVSGSWGYTSSIRTTSGYKSGWLSLGYCRYNGGGNSGNSSRATYNDVFASVKGSGYQLSQARNYESTTFTKGTWVYVWGYLHDANNNLYKTYGSGTCNMTLSIYRPNGSCAFTYTYNNCDCNWIGQSLDEVGNWKIQSKITGALSGTNTRTITVTNPQPTTVNPSSVQLNTYSVSLSKGASKTITATVYPSNATNKSITWTSSNTSVATVSNGTIVGRAPGTATITAKACNGVYTTCSVYVNGITINRNSAIYVRTGDIYSLSTTSYGTSSSKKWSSSNSSVLSVDSSGRITAKKAGTATITVKTSDGYSDSMQITVYGTTLTKSVSFNNSNSYVTVKLNANRGAGYIKIDTYDQLGWWSSAKIHVTMRDTNGRLIWEGETTSGSKLKLGDDHSAYRIYVRASTDYPNTTIGNGDAFVNLGKCVTWKLTCTSNTYID